MEFQLKKRDNIIYLNSDDPLENIFTEIKMLFDRKAEEERLRPLTLQYICYLIYL